MDHTMEERHREDGFEVTFTVSTPRDEAWARLAGAEPAADWLKPPEPGQWWIPAVEGPADELEVVPNERLRARKAAFPCKGTEIVITMEDAGTGTRITFVQNGFGDGFAESRPWLESGWWPIRADLVAFFEHGVSLGRHLRPWASLGCEVRETSSGVAVGTVDPGGLAEQAGAREGDLIVTVGGAPVVNVRELAVVMRMLRSGNETKLRYLRDREVMTGTGTL
jgi:hypothetical protein